MVVRPVADIIELDTDAPPTAKSIINWLYRHQDEIDHIMMVAITGDNATIAHDQRPIPEILYDCRIIAQYGDQLVMGEE